MKAREVNTILHVTQVHLWTSNPRLFYYQPTIQGEHANFKLYGRRANPLQTNLTGVHVSI